MLGHSQGLKKSHSWPNLTTQNSLAPNVETEDFKKKTFRILTDHLAQYPLGIDEKTKAPRI